MIMLSFIVPAHNEERWIGKCLDSIREAMDEIAKPYEVIVVDDASSDATHQIAEQMGARMLRVELRLIAAVRNAGVRVASGDTFFFIDADTEANESAIRAALDALRSGASGGGCVPEFVDPRPVWARAIIWFAVKIARRIRLVGGAFQFCTRDAYNAIGGYDESFVAGEDIAFCQAIKKIGRFVVPGPAVVTSARKLSVVGPWEIISLFITILIRGPHYESSWIVDILYGDRAQACRKPNGKAESQVQNL
jgi:glycosyltransferase involved in cell wall biosynthesis